MEALKAGWDFFQSEALGMSWLNRLIETILNACGLDTSTRVGGSIQFFIYDTIKIMVLLGVLILIISYINTLNRLLPYLQRQVMCSSQEVQTEDIVWLMNPNIILSV